MRLAICAKKSLFAEGLASLLEFKGGFQVVAFEPSPKAVIQSAKELRANVLLVDANGLEGNELQFLLGARAFGSFAVVLMTENRADAEMQDAQIDGRVDRNGSASELFRTIKEAGEKIGPPFALRETRRTYSRRNGGLSDREMECAQLIGKGYSNRKIAEVTGLAEQSVKNLVSVVMRKLSCENRVQVALRLNNEGSAELIRRSGRP